MKRDREMERDGEEDKERERHRGKDKERERHRVRERERERERERGREMERERKRWRVRWRPDRRPASFRSGVGFLRLSNPVLFVYFFSSIPTRNEAFSETFSP